MEGHVTTMFTTLCSINIKTNEQMKILFPNKGKKAGAIFKGESYESGPITPSRWALQRFPNCSRCMA